MIKQYEKNEKYYDQATQVFWSQILNQSAGKSFLRK
jgi:hypothetical protein